MLGKPKLNMKKSRRQAVRQVQLPVCCQQKLTTESPKTQTVAVKEVVMVGGCRGENSINKKDHRQISKYMPY